MTVMSSSSGLDVRDGFLSPSECRDLLAAIAADCAREEPPLIERVEAPRALRYRVLDGNRIHERLPALVDLYRRVEPMVAERFGVVPLKNRAASVNVNITPKGGEYRWHYDRNAVTAILFLNTVAGGELETYPDYRVYLGPRWRASAGQRWLDRLLQVDPVMRVLGRKVSVWPEEGRLVIMRGDRCLHSVRAVEGDQDRLNVIMTFDRAGAAHPQEENLDPYLYSTRSGPSFDPNYVPTRARVGDSSR